MKRKIADNSEVTEAFELATSQGKTVEELKEIATTLQKQVNHHRTMTVKAQGALEVILQMIPKQEVEEMISHETKVNGEMVNDAETTN